MRGIQIRKEKELSLFIGGIVIYIESSKEYKIIRMNKLARFQAMRSL